MQEKLDLQHQQLTSVKATTDKEENAREDELAREVEYWKQSFFAQ